MSVDIQKIAQTLVEANDTCTPVERLFECEDELNHDVAFSIQQEVVRIRVNRGEKVVGFKLGNIAKAMQNRFGVDQPDYGYLLSSDFQPEGNKLYSSDYIEPFVELEPAFILKEELGGEYTTAADVIRAVDFVVPALEIIDSRIKNWEIGIYDTLSDVGSCKSVILGSQPKRINEVNLSDIDGSIYFDGAEVMTGNTAEIYGSPIHALVWLCRRVAEYGVSFRPGDIIIPGSCLEAVPLKKGTKVSGKFHGWGEIKFEYV